MHDGIATGNRGRGELDGSGMAFEVEATMSLSFLSTPRRSGFRVGAVSLADVSTEDWPLQADHGPRTTVYRCEQSNVAAHHVEPRRWGAEVNAMET